MRRMGTNQKTYSANPSDYKLLEEIGHGASATVYRAIYLPLNDVVSVKCLDLDRCNSNLDYICREAQTMSLIDHPNVLRAFCSFVVQRNLWVVMPFMAEGSCLHLLKIAHPDGIEEGAIGSILKETLKALEYLHRQGHIHRDVKAGNLLLDSNGMVKLADFGVSACMFDAGDRQRSRKTFVGTPCWMAPEVFQSENGYNSRADIWSFGITALELAHGRAPLSNYSPAKVLLMIAQNAPPGLNYDSDKRFSKSFQEMVAMCLVKDQRKRPTAEKLLKHSFFKHAKPPELSVKKLFADLPPLWNRMKALELKDAALLALKKMPSAQHEAISQSEYQWGVSAWNFDIEDLKFQASLVRDDNDMLETRDDCVRSFANEKVVTDSRSSLGRSNLDNELPKTKCVNKKGKILENDLLESGCQDQDITGWEKNGSHAEVIASTSEKNMKLSMSESQTNKSYQTQSGLLMPGMVLGHSLSERGHISERCENKTQHRAVWRAPSFGGPLMLPNRASADSLSAPIKSSGGYRDSLDDESKTNVVQKGRFSVTSENVDLVKDIPLCTVPRQSLQGSPLRKSASVDDQIFESKQMSINQSPKDLSNGNLLALLFMTNLQNLFQQNSIQKDIIVTLLNNLQPADLVDATQNGKLSLVPRNLENNGSVETVDSERERLLLVKISEVQSMMTTLTDELNAEKLKYLQLQQQLSAVSAREANGDRREGDAKTSNPCKWNL